MLVSPGFQVVVLVLEATGVRAIPEDKKLVLEFDFGAQLAAWNSFALAYLLLGARAFCRIGRRELVRRLSGSPPPRSAVDTAITTPRMRRYVTLHSVLAVVLNTVVIATVLSLITN